MMSKLIIGCGYLGLQIAEQWLARGEHVFGTTRRQERVTELAEQGIEAIVCDVLNPGSLARLPAVDVVVHGVGLDRQAGYTMRQVYVEGLANVLSALPGTPRFIHISSTSVYVQTDGGEVDETSLTEPTDEQGKVVFEAEQVVRRRRPDAIILRFAGIYGPGRLIRARDLQAGRLLAVDPEKWLNLIHVEDGAQAVIAAGDRGRPGTIYNVSDGYPVRRRDFYTTLAELLDASAPRFVPPPEPVPLSEKINRQIVSSKLRYDLGVELLYPNCFEGLPASQ
jgi:nucleoside-diphosphate-sugar epimerase